MPVQDTLKSISLLSLAMLLPLSACTTSFGGPDRNAAINPAVEVTRFHKAEQVSDIGSGTVVIVPVNEDQVGSSAYRSFASALTRELSLLGYVVTQDAVKADHEARLAYSIIDPSTDGDPFVSAGGPTGAFGQSVGVGLNIPFGGPRRDVLIYRLDVRLSASATGAAFWEGRAIQQAQIGTRGTDPQVFGPILARALFSDFPGPSGGTIAIP